MFHVVEVRFAGEHFGNFLIEVRSWLEAQNTQPRTFRYSLHETDTVLRVNFEGQEQATSFAEAFSGVMVAS